MLKTIGRVALIFFLYFIIQSLYTGVTTTPSEGDSVYYHIPLAHHFLDGGFIRADYGDKFHYFFPASTETLLSILIVFGLPLNIFNLLAMVCLFLSSYRLGLRVNLGTSLAVIFGVSVSLVMTVSRWALAQTVDIWLAVYYFLSLQILLKKKIETLDYLWLGIAMGLLVGSKYSGLAFTAILGIIFWRKWFHTLTIKKVVLFLIPFLLVGVSWYVRNWVAVGNPFYPLHTSLFPGLPGLIPTQVGDAIVAFPISMLNAYISEYMVWSVLVVLLFFLLLLPKIRNRVTSLEWSLLGLSVGNFMVFLCLPSGDSYQLHVSQFRFSYVVFMPMILVLFILAKKLKLEKVLGVIALANLFLLPPLAYSPKLLFVYIPLATVVFFWEETSRYFHRTVAS